MPSERLQTGLCGHYCNHTYYCLHIQLYQTIFIDLTSCEWANGIIHTSFDEAKPPQQLLYMCNLQRVEQKACRCLR